MTEIPVEPPHDHVALLRVERDAFLALLRSLRPEDWARPTPCPGWSVLDLCCHVLGDDLGSLARDRDAHFGTVPPPGVDEDGFVDWLDALNRDWVTAMRRLSPRLVVDLLAETGMQLVDAFTARDPRARTALVSWAGDEPVPVWLDHARELTERWVHQQQVRRAVGLGPWLEPTMTGVVLDALRWTYPWRLRGCRRPAGSTVSVAVVDRDDARWHLVSDGSAWHFGPAPADRSAVVAEAALTTDEAWRLLTGNLRPTERRALAIAGEPDLVARLLDARAVIGRPDATPA